MMVLVGTQSAMAFSCIFVGKKMLLPNDFLLLLMTMKSVSAHITDASFDKVEPGQNITGKLGPEQPARSKIQCSSM